MRIKLRKRAPTAGIGAHLHRHMGHSLEFREYRDYTFGEDIRTVDWAASARLGQDWDLVAKSFEAEERRSLIVLLDCRAAMRLPQSVPKLGVALWIAECLITAALEEKDQVSVLPVFAGAKRARHIKVAGPKGIAALRAYVADMMASPLARADWNEVPEAGLAMVRPLLKPAAAIVLITDALFDDPRAEMTNFARRAQRSFRTFHVVEIDSWPHERAMLQAKPFRLQALGGADFGDQLSEATAEFLLDAETRLVARRADIRRRSAGPGMIWPKAALAYPNAATFDSLAAQDWFLNTVPQAAFFTNLLSRAG
jgi:uncharacterized protein (DUF58 family)